MNEPRWRPFWVEMNRWHQLRMYLPASSNRPEDYWTGQLADSYRRCLLSVSPRFLTQIREVRAIANWLHNLVFDLQNDPRFWLLPYVPYLFLMETSMDLLLNHGSVTLDQTKKVMGVIGKHHKRIIPSSDSGKERRVERLECVDKRLERLESGSSSKGGARNINQEHTNEESIMQAAQDKLPNGGNGTVTATPESKANKNDKMNKPLNNSNLTFFQILSLKKEKITLKRKLDLLEKELSNPLTTEGDEEEIEKTPDQISLVVKEKPREENILKYTSRKVLQERFGIFDLSTIEEENRCSTTIMIQGYIFEAVGINKKEAIEEAARRALMMGPYLLREKDPKKKRRGSKHYR